MDPFDFSEPLILTVSALNNYLREMIETDEILQDVWVRGEISNLNAYRSGHLYFTLKDADAQIRCVMWKNAALRLRFDPDNGMAVEAHGAMGVYPTQGQVQLYVDSMRPVGEGTLFQEFLRLKARLEAEGLFDASHKRPIPDLPAHIGIVTSASGAALQDILNTLTRRLPSLRISLAPTLVQGSEAPAGIVQALQRLQTLPDLDLIIVARGGGSIEDLWAFNDEQVARAVYAARVPVITGVGHETDFTIVDFVSDLRAPTPTAAAELATPITRQELLDGVRSAAVQLDGALTQKIARLSHSLNLAGSELQRYSPRQRVQSALQRLDELGARLDLAAQAQWRAKTVQVELLSAQLESLSPLSVLKRGYAIITNRQTGAVISRISQASPGLQVDLRVQDGSLPATLNHPNTGETPNA